MITKEFQKILNENAFLEGREVEGHGICALQRMMFTVGIYHNIGEYSSDGRWCYHTYKEAKEAFDAWDGKGDPSGNWIKYKGVPCERPNPKYDHELRY